MILICESITENMMPMALLSKEGMTNQELSENLGMDKSLTYLYIKAPGIRYHSFNAEGKAKRYYVKEDKKSIVIELLTDKNVKALRGTF